LRGDRKTLPTSPSSRPSSASGAPSPSVGGVALPFAVSDAAVLAAQASLVALPCAAPPRGLHRLARAGWALVPAGSIAIVIGAIALAPGTADALTWLALIATPPLAALAPARGVVGAPPGGARAGPPLPPLARAP